MRQRQPKGIAIARVSGSMSPAGDSHGSAAVASRKTRMNPPYRLFLLATAALAAPALAQETPADVVVTAAGAPPSVNETGDAITVVTRADLEARQTLSIAAYLANIGRGACRERGCNKV